MKKTLMLKDGQWVEWDGSDVDFLITTETMTLAQMKKRFPEEYKKIIKEKQNG